jgi:uncharacterized protein (DUF488 family)
MAKTSKPKKKKAPAKTAVKKPRGAKRAGKATPLFTIGFEQAKPAAVMKELEDAKIDLVVDTRAVAASRRPGFSKRQLSASLVEAGIGYVHLQKLGTPAEGRQAARAGDRDTLMRVYDAHINKPEPQAELGKLVSLIKSGKRIALLCYCRDPKTCHRSQIVKRVKARLPLEVENLIPPLF